MFPADLPPEWLATAKVFREHAEERVAIAYERCATHLEEALVRAGEEPLSLQEAAEESGYSADHLGRLVRDGKLPNAGRPNAPRIRRADLPSKPPRRQVPVAEPKPRRETSPRQIVQSIIEEIE